jgi:hypothetical protein
MTHQFNYIVSEALAQWLSSKLITKKSWVQSQGKAVEFFQLYFTTENTAVET